MNQFLTNSRSFCFVKQTFFAIKIGHFIVIELFSYDTTFQADLQKSENEEKQSLVGLTSSPKRKFNPQM
jgi:hypothetical protein